MKRWFWAAPIALFGLLFFHPIPAVAGLHICNKTNHRISFAIGTLVGDCSPDCIAHTKGWWNIGPGDCKTPIGSDLDTSGTTLYYYYAEDSGGSTWTGTFSLCVDPQSAFDYGDNANADCAGSRKSFRRINIGDNTDYTLSLTP
jgi:uncharacterized membrane protein